jgi:hypothetical protein
MMNSNFIIVGLAIGLSFGQSKTTATRKWLCGKNLDMVGAEGFELEPFCGRERSGSLQAKS